MSKSEGLSRLSKFIYRLTVIVCVCLMLFVLYVYAMADKISDVNNVATLLLPYGLAAGANTPLPYSTLLALPSLLISATLPKPLTLAAATLFATAA